MSTTRQKAPRTAEEVAISYLRFSHPDQAKGDSLRRQKKDRDAWLQRNHVRLDTSIVLEDRGVSGYTGEHRDNPDRHALASLLEMVKEGHIRKGTYLIVESLDRLTREDIIPALTLVLNLMQAGIRIVQLRPVEIVYDRHADSRDVQMMIMELVRGNSESAMKSERVGAAWQEKKANARSERRPLTRRTPCWLRVVGPRHKDRWHECKWELIPDAVAAVKRIYQLATDGHGIASITKRLNAEAVPTIGVAGKRTTSYWARSYVAKILSNPAVFGQYQPYKGRGRKRQPDGPPIDGYYPAVITEDEWYAARAALASRKGKVGRAASHHVNLFTHLLRDARTGGTLQMVNKGKKGGGRLLAPYRANQGIGKFTSFPLPIFEKAILSKLREIDPKDILPDQKGTDRTDELTGRLAALDSRIAKIKARLRTDPELEDTLFDTLKALADERRQLVDELSTARQEAASPVAEAWTDAKSVAEVLAENDTEDARLKLRAALRRIVDTIFCFFTSKGRTRIAAVQMYFTGGDQRAYLMWYDPPIGGAIGPRPADWGVKSWIIPEGAKYEGYAPIDFRSLDAEGIKAVDELLKWYIV